MLMLIAFVAIAVSARGEWHEERFSPLYLDETLADTREATILFADLQGFTSFSEQTPPARVAAMLNGYFGRLVPLLEQHGGVVHQIIGDAVMVIFNQRGDQPDHAVRAARTALAFQAARGRDRRAATLTGLDSARGQQRRGPRRPRRRPERPSQARRRRRHGQPRRAAGGECSGRQVVVGADTAAALPPGAVLERLPPLEVKGKEEPIEAFVLHALRAG